MLDMYTGAPTVLRLLIHLLTILLLMSLVLLQNTKRSLRGRRKAYARTDEGMSGLTEVAATVRESSSIPREAEPHFSPARIKAQ